MKVTENSYNELTGKSKKKTKAVKKESEEKKQNDTVIILGTAGTLKVTPWDKPDTDYWACGPAITHKETEGHRIDAVFEMHPMEYWITIIERLNTFVDKNPNTTIYMQTKNSEIKNCEAYPLKEIQTMANNEKLAKYFTSSIAYMIAAGIYKGYKFIELYGVHMSSEEEEYSLQRSCCEAWLNFGLGRGSNYWIPDASDVMSCSHLYGYEQNKGRILDLIHQEEGLMNGVKELDKKIEDIKRERYLNEGAALMCKKLIKMEKKKGG